MPSTPVLSVRGDSPRSLSKSATLEYYKRELLAAQYREAVLKRRIKDCNVYLASMGLQINPNPWDAVALTMDGLPVAPGV